MKFDGLEEDESPIENEKENETETEDEGEEYEMQKTECEKRGFQPPLAIETIREANWNLISKFAEDATFLGMEELSKIPRKFDFPFCHPGPEHTDETGDWFLVDSIVQKVTVRNEDRFVVRWIGYEDE